MRLFGSSKIDQEGQLSIGGIRAKDLTEEYASPLYVMDEDLIIERCKLFKENFRAQGLLTEVIYASKAFLTIYMCKLVEAQGLSLDVVSGGELYTAIKAGFPLEKVYFHGNNKTKEELRMAIENQIGRIVIDNRYEIDLIEAICQELGMKISALIRVNPGIEAHTHEYIQTTKNDSKFGEATSDQEIYKILDRLGKSAWIDFKGLHCHIGSQIFAEESFYEEVDLMMDFIKSIQEQIGLEIEELNLGGGFGVYYTEEDQPMDMEGLLKNMAEKVLEKAKQLDLKLPKAMIEPGRAIVANAGTTLYEAGPVKTTGSGKEYVFVDGGMTDNIRTALYQAKYEAALASRMTEEDKSTFTLGGRCCESGDIVVRDVRMARPEPGELVAVFSTGAYNYSMSSNYNRMLRPAVVFVKDGKSKCVVRRESYEDLIRNDMV